MMQERGINDRSKVNERNPIQCPGKALDIRSFQIYHTIKMISMRQEDLCCREGAREKSFADGSKGKRSKAY